MNSYVDVIENPEWMDRLPSRPEIEVDEVILGMYINNISSLENTVAFTTSALYLLDGASWKELKYSDIDQVISPKDKDSVKGVEIVRKYEGNFWLPIFGCKDGKFYDAFEVMRFLLRVAR
jgi:hypothetical protein